jgi:hypothetical protein
LFNYKKECCPETINNPIELNNSRATALMEIQNGVTFCAMLKGILNIDDAQQKNGDVHPGLLFNVDATTLYLGNKDKEKVLLAKGSKEKLQKNGFSPGKWKKGCKYSKFFDFDDFDDDEDVNVQECDLPEEEYQGQRRCVKLLITTSAAGKISSVIIIIKDTCFTDVEVLLVDRTLYAIYLILVPKVVIVTDSDDTTDINDNSEIIYDNEENNNESGEDSDEEVTINETYINTMILQHCIIPEMLNDREKLCKENEGVIHIATSKKITIATKQRAHSQR